MSIVRKSLGTLGAAAMLFTATAASASIRPADSVVSNVAPVSVMGARQGAALAQTNQASTTTWVLTFIVIGTIIIAIWIAVDSDDEPVSP